MKHFLNWTSYIVSNVRMSVNNVLERMRNVKVMTYFKAPSCHFSGGT